MAAASASRSVPTEDWITPQEQLRRLRQWDIDALDSVPSLRERNMRDVLGIVADLNAPAALTNWYKALESLDLLPERIPPLPHNIHQILMNKCPIKGNQLKPDGTPYRIIDTHSLYLIPRGTLNELEARVSAYGQRVFGNENSLQFRYFWPEARREHGDVPFEAEWILISNDVLEESRSQLWERQVEVVQQLNTDSFTDYQIPTLREAAAFMFLHKVATGESLYQAGNEQNGGLYTYTRVQNTTQRGWRLVVGGFAPSGVNVSSDFDYVHEDLGVAVLRKF